MLESQGAGTKWEWEPETQWGEGVRPRGDLSSSPGTRTGHSAETACPANTRALSPPSWRGKRFWHPVVTKLSRFAHYSPLAKNRINHFFYNPPSRNMGCMGRARDFPCGQQWTGSGCMGDGLGSCEVYNILTYLQKHRIEMTVLHSYERNLHHTGLV